MENYLNQNLGGHYNDLENQLRYDPTTGQILEFYDQPSGKTDAVAMQHDVDYSICKADRKMVNALDAIPYKDCQWGHWLARNLIITKQKLGLGVKQTKKKPKKRKALSKNDWAQQLADELHKPIKRKFKTRRVNELLSRMMPFLNLSAY